MVFFAMFEFSIGFLLLVVVDTRAMASCSDMRRQNVYVYFPLTLSTYLRACLFVESGH
jgi:hypothetical protein